MDISSLPPPPALALRFTHSNNEEKDRFIKFLTELKLPAIAALENADEQVSREHIHSIIFTDLDTEKLRKRFKAKSYFPVLRKSDYSIKTIENTPEDLARMFRYTVKGIQHVGPNILFSSFTKELIDEQHVKYWETNLEYQEQVKKLKSEKKLREKRTTWMEQLADDLANNPIVTDMMDEQSLIKLTQYVIVHLGKSAKKLSRKIIYEIVFGLANAQLVRQRIKCPDYKRDYAYDQWAEYLGKSIAKDVRNSLEREWN